MPDSLAGKTELSSEPIGQSRANGTNWRIKPMARKAKNNTEQVSKPEAITDAERLDALEAFIKTKPLVLWWGDGKLPHAELPVLSLFEGSMTLRQALDSLTGLR